MADLITGEPETKKLPGNLNALTILTFIGCGFAFLIGIWQFINAEKGVTDMEKAMANPDLPDFAKRMMTPEALENARLMAANKLPMLLLGLIGVGLCLFGAMQMRKLKLQGYYLWLIGEILPVIGTLIFIGTGAFKGWAAAVGYVFFFVFIILYTMQRKYLINK